MPKNQVTTEEISQAILHRLSTGQYGPGDRLPSVRDLAEELGTTRNTVNKAYQSLLEMGMIELLGGGRKGFSVRSGSPIDARSRDDLINYFYQQAVQMVWQGMAAGVPAEDMLAQLNRAVDEVYGQSDVHIIFLECNAHDTEEMGRNLRSLLGLDVEYALLDSFYLNQDTIEKEYDLIVTTFHHIAEVCEAVLNTGGTADKVVGIDTRPTPDTMLRIARLPNRRIGLISTFESTANMLRHLFQSYYPGWTIEAVSLENVKGIQAIAEKSDHLVVTHTCVDDVKSLTGRTADVVVNFQIDDQSMTFLQQRINEIQKTKTGSLKELSILQD
jgi:GntR family transcriptional regulator